MSLTTLPSDAKAGLQGFRASASVTSYESAGTDAGDLKYWQPWLGSPDADLLPELSSVTARSRDIERNSGLAAGAPQTVIDHALGHELQFHARPNWRALGKSQQWARDWAQHVEGLFRPYANSKQWDVQRKNNLTKMAHLVLRGMWSNGRHLVLPFFQPERVGVRYATCFMAIEGDRICNPESRPDTDRLRGGVQFDRFGAPDGYWVANRHPGELGGLFLEPNSWEFIPAMTPWGRARALHCFRETRSGQTTGAPALASVLREFKSLQRYRTAELNRAVIHALNVYFVRSHLPAEWIQQIFHGPEDYLEKRKGNVEANRSAFGNAAMGKPGILPLSPGDEIVDPRRDSPNDQMGTFEEVIKRGIAAALGLSYESFCRDFSRTNYSSARAAMLMDWRTFMQWRADIFQQYCKPSYTLWLEEAINMGDIEASDFYDNIDAYTECRFVGPGRGLIDPAKETAAAVNRLSKTLSTQEIETADQGYDWEEMQFQRAIEIDSARRLVTQFKLPESAIYVLAGIDAPASERLTTPPGPGSGLIDEPEAA